MGKIANNAATILAFIESNGEVTTSAELREEFADMPAGDRAAAVQHLKASGKIVSSGSTAAIEYRLGKGNEAAKPGRAPDPFDVSAPLSVKATQPTLAKYVDPEFELMAALDAVAFDFLHATSGSAYALRRATAWLASKYEAA